MGAAMRPKNVTQIVERVFRSLEFAVPGKGGQTQNGPQSVEIERKA